ncbi:MAG TPA: hypothetical protein VFH97_00790 [Gemmatimonadales bacterium]|nr:hypothetical protein [Gemmatimonadales bacterium]
MRPSHPTLVAVSRSLAAVRGELVAEWTRWTLDRVAAAPTVRAATLERQLGVIVDILIEMSGPLRRKALELWISACEGYGRTAAERGLAAGEVVEEIQYLRELLIRHLSEVIAALPARASMATVLRLNRLLDTGIAHAVVGYTDTLVETLFNQRGVPVGVSGAVEDEIEERLTQAETELAALRRGS